MLGKFVKGTIGKLYAFVRGRVRFHLSVGVFPDDNLVAKSALQGLRGVKVVRRLVWMRRRRATWRLLPGLHVPIGVVNDRGAVGM